MTFLESTLGIKIVSQFSIIFPCTTIAMLATKSTTSTTSTSSNPSLNEKAPIDTKTAPQLPPQLSADDSCGPAPEGGAKAWLNAACGFCIFFCCLGFTSCFGVLQEYYSTHQLHDRTPASVGRYLIGMAQM
jgi:hypothetical protein